MKHNLTITALLSAMLLLTSSCDRVPHAANPGDSSLGKQVSITIYLAPKHSAIRAASVDIITLATIAIEYQGRSAVGMSRPSLAAILEAIVIAADNGEGAEEIGPTGPDWVGGGRHFLHESDYVCLYPGDIYAFDLSLRRSPDGAWTDSLVGYTWDLYPDDMISAIRINIPFMLPWDAGNGGKVIREIRDSEYIFGALPGAEYFIGGELLLSVPCTKDGQVEVDGELSLTPGEGIDITVSGRLGLPPGFPP